MDKEPIYAFGGPSAMLWRVVDIDNPDVGSDIFYWNGQDALLAELLSNPILLPKSLRELGLEGFSKTVKGQIQTRYRFPSSERYRLCRCRPKQILEFRKRVAAAQEFRDARNNNINFAALYNSDKETRLLGAKLITANVINENLTYNWDAVFDNVENAYRVGINQKIGMQEIRISRPDDVEIVEWYSISWAGLWETFIYIFNRVGSNVKSILEWLTKVVVNGGTSAYIIKGQIVTGYDDCHPGILGFVNDSASCFADSALMSMFAFKNSPFHEGLLHKFREGAGLVSCNTNPAENERLRRLVFDTLSILYGGMVSGRPMVCASLRQILGRDCNISGNLEDDFSFQQGDPGEYYLRLMRVLDYNPIKLSETLKRASNSSGEGEYIALQSTTDIPALPRLRAEIEHLNRISWPQSWMADYENNGSGDKAPWMKTEYNIVSADVIVVTLDRSYNRYQAPQVQPQQQMPLVSTATMSGDDILSSILSGMNIVSPGPTNPAYVNPNAVVSRRIPVDLTFVVNDQQYDLRSFVYSPYDGHYAAMLKCGSSWFNYDDMNVTGPISTRVTDSRTAIDILETRGVLFFYYLPFPKWSFQEQKMMADISQSLANIRHL